MTEGTDHFDLLSHYDDDFLRKALAGLGDALLPPMRRPLAEWADEHYYLSAESSHVAGKWRTLPYQRGVMNAVTDPTVERVSWMKSARVGATKMLNACVGYYMTEDPCPMMTVQPTVEDAQGYSREEIAPMLRDCPILANLVSSDTRKSGSTILHKQFPGGSLSMVGANSARGFRRVSRKVVMFDEVDAYPPSAGAEGDQIKLGIRRTEYFWDRKIIAVSTPTVAGASRIEQMFLDGDQRRYHVPCPHCGTFDFLTFSERPDGRGHRMIWPEGKPEQAAFQCRHCEGRIEESSKLRLLEAGDWIADAEFEGHASFHIWAAYSMSPNATWGTIAKEFVDAKRRSVDELKTVVNTVLGETWQERGDAPAWERLFERRAKYQLGSVPDGVLFLTAGIDVQKDRFVFEVVGWDAEKRSWSIDSGMLMGDTGDDRTWAQLDDLLSRTFPTPSGGEMPISMLAVDSGYNTQQVYSWCRRYPMTRVIACKGVANASVLVGMPSPVDLRLDKRSKRRAYRVWPVGVGLAKAELYGWLRLPPPVEGMTPPGYCRFPEYGPDFFKQLTAEHLVATKKRGGFTVYEWQIMPGRENHFLDCRVYARAAAGVLGLDRAQAPKREAAKAMPPKRQRQRDSWLRGRRR